jgi:ferric-dicitrate binding protein FerR (iron transport regulator)
MTETTRADRNAELLQLVEASCNGTITDEQFARLEERLCESPPDRAFYRRYANLHSALQEYGDVSGQGWYAASLDELNKASRFRWGMRIAIASAAVCLVVAAGLLALHLSSVEELPSIIGRFESITGTVTVAADGAGPRIAADGDRIRSAENVRLPEDRSAATIMYADGSRFVLRGKTALKCADNTLEIYHGLVIADVVPPDNSRLMHLSTPHHKLSVGEGKFELWATEDNTTLTVTAGRVTVMRIGDGQAIVVEAGQRFVSRAGSPFRLEKSNDVVWSAGFEQGLPPGWRLGRFVKTGLPRGSHGGVEAVTARVQDGVYHSIAGPERWEGGLFRFEANLHVHVTLKMSQPGWINIFLFTKINRPGKSKFAGNYLFNDTPFLEMKPGRWYSLTIPITEFRRLFPTDGGQFDGVIPYQIALSSKGESRGLVVDELRITRGGPGRVVLNEVE